MNLSKESAIHSALVGMALKMRPGEKYPTVRQLAKQLSVSGSTLDRVLRKLENERIIIRQHGTGIYVSPHSQKRTFGLIFAAKIYSQPRQFSPFWTLLHQSAIQKAESLGSELRVYFGCPTNDVEGDRPPMFALVDDIRSGRLSGIILVGGPGLESISWLQQRRVHLASLGFSLPSVPSVEVRWQRSLAMGLQALQSAGCKRIAYVSGGCGDKEYRDEIDPVTQEYKKLILELGLDYDPDLRWHMANVLQENFPSPERAGKALVSTVWERTRSNLDGLVIFDDTVAHGVLVELLRRGVSVGKGLKVAVQTNKDSRIIAPFNDEIYRLEVSPHDLVEKLFDFLDFQNKLHASPEESHVDVPISLIPPA